MGKHSGEIDIHEFFLNNKGKLPSFIESIDEMPHIKILKMRGAFDSTTVPELNFFVNKARKNPMAMNKSFLLDFRKATSIDTASIASILKVLSTLKKKNHRLGIVNASKALKNQLEILRLEKIVTVFDSWKSALLGVHEWSEGEL